MDLGDQKEIRDLKAKRDLLGLMAYRVSQACKGLQVLQGPQAAMEQMEMMDLLVVLGPMVLMGIQVHQVYPDLRVNLSYQLIHNVGLLGRLEEMEAREIQVSLEETDHKGTPEQGGLLGILVPQGLGDLRVKKVQVVSQDIEDQRGDRGQKAYRGHRVGLESI